MSMFNCNCKCRCTTAAVIVSAVIGVLTAFLHVTGVVTAAPVFLWAALGAAAVYLGVLVVAAALAGRTEQSGCMCSALNALLAGLLGTILFAAILLAVGVVATSVVTAILVGLLLFFLTLAVTGSACYVRSLTGCGN